MNRDPVAGALNDDPKVSFDRVLDSRHDVLDGGREYDHGRTQIGSQIPRLARVVVAAVVGEDERVMAGSGHSQAPREGFDVVA